MQPFGKTERKNTPDHSHLHPGLTDIPISGALLLCFPEDILQTAGKIRSFIMIRNAEVAVVFGAGCIQQPGGAGVGTVHNHFASKDEIVAACVAAAGICGLFLPSWQSLFGNIVKLFWQAILRQESRFGISCGRKIFRKTEQKLFRTG